LASSQGEFVVLTGKQQLLIQRYLRDVEEQLASLPDKRRRQVIEETKIRIEQELSRFVRTPLQDHDVQAILKRCGSPTSVAAPVLGKAPRPGRWALGPEDRRWLGVCKGLANGLQADAQLVRLGAILLGLITGPLAIIAYLAAYFALYPFSDPDMAPRIQKGKLLRAVTGPVAIALLLFGITKTLIALARYGRQRFLEMPTGSDLGTWDWLEAHNGVLLSWALFVLIPLAGLSGLPMSNDWGSTMKKVVQAGLAIYAVALCFGLACLLTGIILHVVKGLALQY
jgi:phage shock protein PspC (stress-responsive transcriptional regulator)